MKYNNIDCTICGKEVPKRDYKIQQELASNSKFGFVALCPDCFKKK